MIRRVPLLFAIASMVSLLATAAYCAAPWAKLAPTKKMAKGDSYSLTDKNGPWMVMATTFSGEGAEDQAYALVQELRTKYGLPAYTFKKEFDFSKPVEGRGVNKYGESLKMKHQKAEINEIAVLVGDYAS